MSGHTLGIWKMREVWVNFALRKWEVGAGDYEDEWCRERVAEVFTSDDARLIAAAPDLLEACKASLIAIPAAEYPGDPVGKIANGIRAAIAKAEGKQS
jgi:hypothetical protein